MSAILLLARVRRPREMVLFAILPVVSAAGWLAFFYTVYGTPNPAVPYGAMTQSSASNMLRGLPGVFFDQQFGLIPNAPIYGLVLSGCLVAALRLRRWSLELLALIVPYTISVAMYQMWWGGASAAARLLAPLSLVIGMGAARLWTEGSAATRVLYAAGLGASVFIAALLWIPDDGRLLINFRDGIALWLEWAHDDLLLARAAPSLFTDTPIIALAKASIWVAVAAAFWGVLTLLRPLSARAAMVIVLIAGMPMIGLAMAWRLDGRGGISAARSEAGLLRQLSRNDRWSWDFDQRRLISADALRARLTIRSDDQRPRSRPSHVLSALAVPPGHYRVLVDARPGAAGTLTLRVGDTSLPFLTLPAAAGGDADGAAARTLVLPVGARSLVIEADAAAVRAVVSARLLPVTSDLGASSAGGFESGTASRAARYPAADAFFLDDNAYPEPTGFWIAGGRRAHLVIARGRPALTLFVRNAAVANTVTIEVDGTRQELALAAGEQRELPLASADRRTISTLRVTSASGFRPSQTEPGNRDLRYLGCWVELH